MSVSTPREYRLSIGGMACAGCVTAVEKALLAVPGYGRDELSAFLPFFEGEVWVR